MVYRPLRWLCPKLLLVIVVLCGFLPRAEADQIKQTGSRRLLTMASRFEDLIHSRKSMEIVSRIGDKALLCLGDKIVWRLGSRATSLYGDQLLSRFVEKKARGGEISRDMFQAFVNGIHQNRLSESQVELFLRTMNTKGNNGLSPREMARFARAVAASGSMMKWGDDVLVMDKHCAGGVNGRATIVITSILAAFSDQFGREHPTVRKIIIPKVSSKTITSATASGDVFEFLMGKGADLSPKDTRRVVKETNACLAWGGGESIAPVDSKLIAVRKKYDYNSLSLVTVSILAKKLAMGSKYVLVEIPTGDGARYSKDEAKRLGEHLIAVGQELGMTVRVMRTDGTRAVGNAFGVREESNEAIQILQNDRSASPALRRKSLAISATMIQDAHALSGLQISRKQAMVHAKQMLESGAAWKKFEQIVGAQGGDPNALRVEPPQREAIPIRAPSGGRVVLTRSMHEANGLAQKLGAPIDPQAGFEILKRSGQVNPGEVLLRLYPGQDFAKAQLDEVKKEALKLVEIK
jgi:thymidine phosphorylase